METEQSVHEKQKVGEIESSQALTKYYKDLQETSTYNAMESLHEATNNNSAQLSIETMNQMYEEEMTCSFTELLLQGTSNTEGYENNDIVNQDYTQFSSKEGSTPEKNSYTRIQHFEELESDTNPWDQSIFERMNLESVIEANDEAERNEDEVETNKDEAKTINQVHMRDDISEANTEGQQKDNEKELTEEYIESFLENEEQAVKQGNNVEVETKYTPRIGQQFKSSKEAHHYFNLYAFLVGFSMVITHTYHTTSKKGTMNSQS